MKLGFTCCRWAGLGRSWRGALCLTLLIGLPRLGRASLLQPALNTNASVSEAATGFVNQHGTSGADVSLALGSGSASAGYGVLKAYAGATGIGDPLGNSAVQSAASASFVDVLTFFGQPFGTPGTMLVSMSFAGTVSAGPCDAPITGVAGCSASISGGAGESAGSGGFSAGASVSMPGSPNPKYSGFGPSSSVYTFQYGVPFNISASVVAGAFDDGIVSGNATADSSHSVYWGGISNVTANGVPFDGFTVTSGSGTDWTKSFIPSASAVPEPGTATLAGLALGALGLIRLKASSRTGGR